MYVDVESEEVTEWTCDTEEVEVGLLCPSMAEYKLFVTKFCIANCIEVEKFKDDPTRLKCKCKVKKCPFRLYAKSYWVSWKGKALTKKFGSYEDGYKFAPEIMDQILKKNAGSITLVTTDTYKDFNYCCLAFYAFLIGFKDGCRPFIGLDGCFLKGKYGGVMLSAVALDGNNGMYPLAIFICDFENKENWIIFLNLIKARLLEHPAPLTFISDRQKGLVPTLQEVFSSSRNRFCFRHIFENFKTKGHKGTYMKTLAWGAAKAYRNTYHNKYMATMETDNKRAHQWFEDIPTHLWERSTFDTTSKCEHVTNNFSESFNSWSLDVRSKPLHRILEGFNLKMMGLMFDRKMKNHETSSRWNVDVKEKICNCNVRELTGIPCVHVVSVSCHLRLNINSMVHDYHKISSYKKAYAGKVVACDSQDHWNEEHPMVVYMPKFKIKTSRLRTKRIRSDVEGEQPHKKAKRSCTNCSLLNITLGLAQP
ncbi:uncharacterized protein LOC113359134 [Papaver somniferum]|uniref:uncharacterized protein LOC113359134 n=1 Tax=Papaver somniferum TaxID=3469 RepID=UPI000E6F848B|nr:uncharacterized protein LOC113359134 [Papaver somniferum]